MITVPASLARATPWPVRVRLAGQAKQPVVTPDHLFQAVAHGGQKVLVGLDDPARRGELDHRHGAADGLEQAFAFVFLHNPLADV